MDVLKYTTLFGARDAVAEAIDRIRGYEPLAGPDGYWVGYSGGKDSVAVLELCRMAGVKHEAHHSLTTIDPPELVRFIRQNASVTIDRPPHSFLEVLVKKGIPPLRHRRWCCEVFKEHGGDGRLVITGIRWAESPRRARRKMFDVCYKDRGQRLLHPIIDWSDAQVWAFIRERNLPYCKLYDEGKKRLGCLFCPMSSKASRIADLDRYPKYAAAFRKAFRKLHDKRLEAKPDSVKRWHDGDAMFDWWIREPPRNDDSEAGVLFD